MRTLSSCLLVTLLVVSLDSFAADPTTIAELKEHFKSLATDKDTFSADYNMTMDMAEIGQPGTAAMSEMNMKGKIQVRGDQMRWEMSMNMPMGDETMEVTMDMVMDSDNVMHMLMDTMGMVQVMKLDMSVMEDLAEELGIPASAMNSGNMSMGSFNNPAKMLDIYDEMYDLRLKGKDTVDGEDVYVVIAVINEETLKNFESNPLLAAQADMLKRPSMLYIGAKDGVMRKSITGGYMTMTLSNIDFGSEITDDTFELDIPEGAVVMDLTEMMQGMFGNQ